VPVFADERGWFTEQFNAFRLAAKGVHLPQFVQDNLSFSRKNVIRGLHLQASPHMQDKMVTVLQGRVLDVVVDLRPASTTFRSVFAIELSADKHNALFVPKGFAHGFAALEDALFSYKCSYPYTPEAETGIIWNDADLAINWQVNSPIVSAKDQALPTLKQLLQKNVISQNG